MSYLIIEKDARFDDAIMFRAPRNTIAEVKKWIVDEIEYMTEKKGEIYLYTYESVISPYMLTDELFEHTDNLTLSGELYIGTFRHKLYAGLDINVYVKQMEG